MYYKGWIKYFVIVIVIAHWLLSDYYIVFFINML